MNIYIGIKYNIIILNKKIELSYIFNIITVFRQVNMELTRNDVKLGRNEIIQINKKLDNKNLEIKVLSKKRFIREVLLLKTKYKTEFKEVNMDIYEDTLVISAKYMGHNCVYEVNHNYMFNCPPKIYIDDELYLMDNCDFSPVMTVASLFITFSSIV